MKALFLKNIFAGSSLSEKIAFYLLLTFLFFLNFSIAVCNIVFTVLLILSLFIYFKNHIKITFPDFYKYILLYIAFTLISTLFSIDFLNSFKDNKEVFIYLLVPVIIIILDNREKLLTSLYTLLISSFLSAAAGIVISINSGISLQHRLKGFTSHWMTYSGLLMIVFVFFFIFSIFETSGKLRILNFIALASILIAIIFSLTRSSWMGIFISLGIFIIYYFRKRPLIIFLLLIFSIIFFLILPKSVENRVKSIFDMKNITNVDRFHMAYTAVEIIKDYPLTGVGSDNVKKVYPEYRHPNATKNNPHLHNNFFQIAAERGILSIFAFIAFIISVYLSLIKKIKSGTGLTENISLAVLFLFTAFLIAGLFEYNFGDSEIKFILFYFISIPFLPFLGYGK